MENERREERRQRDREMWAWEDRNRFTQQKREAYVEYQNSAYRISEFFTATERALANARASNDSSNFSQPDFLESRCFAEDFTKYYDELKLIRNKLRLMAPATILSATTEIDRVLIPAIEIFMGGPGETRKLWSDLRQSRLNLFDAMRQDLNPDQHPIVTEESPYLVGDVDADTASSHRR